MAATRTRCRQVWTDGEDRPRCSGHGAPMHSDGPNWRCAIKHRAVVKRRERVAMAEGVCTCCFKNPLHTAWLCEGCVKKARPRNLAYWHKADGGYIRARKRNLQEQRAGILLKLAELGTQ
jgi:hypothetical protein